MKYIAKMHLAFNKAVENIRNKKGQNTIEYMLMLLVIIGVVFAVGALIKNYMPDLFQQIKDKITGGASKI